MILWFFKYLKDSINNIKIQNDDDDYNVNL